MKHSIFATLTIVAIIIATAATTLALAQTTSAVASSNANNNKKTSSSSSSSASTTTKKPTRYSSAWLPDWLPNIHRMNKRACDAITDFRDHSPILRRLVENNKSDAARHASVTTESVSEKLKRAASAATSGQLADSLGYNYAKLNAHANPSPLSGGGYSNGEPRLLCLGFSHLDNGNKDETGLSQMWNSWAKKCDQTLLYTRKKSIPGVPPENTREIHPIMGDGANNLWQKIRLALSMLADPRQDGKILQSVDFVIFFTDDAFFSVSNAKAMLMEPYIVAANRANALLLLGHRMNDKENIFVSNLGYIMNKQLIRILADLVNTPACDPMAQTGSDDIQMGRCLQSYGVYPFDTYDEIGEDRMVMWDPEMLAYSVSHGFPEWYIRYRARPVLKTLRIVAQHALAFHGVNTPEKINRLQNLVG